MDIFTAIFGSKEAKAQAKAQDEVTREAKAQEKQDRIDAREAKREAKAQERQDRIDARLAAQKVRQDDRVTKKRENSSITEMDWSANTANVKARQQAKTDRAQAKADARVNVALAKAQTNIARAQAGDTTSPGQDIVANLLGTFQEQSDQVMGLAATYLGSKALGSGLSAAQMLAESPGAQASIDTPVGSGSVSASTIGLGIAAIAAIGIAISGKKK